MIITRVTGGLGNQLFQYAAGLALARLRQATLLLDVTWYDLAPNKERHETFALPAYVPDWERAGATTLCRVRGLGRSTLGRLQALGLRCALRLTRRLGPIARVGDGDFSYQASFPQLPDDTYLDGNWQSARYFEPVAGEMRSRLLGYRPVAPAVLALGREIGAHPAAFVHVRRGDYVSNRHYQKEIGPVDADYYRAALAALASRAGGCRLFVFTNDADWTRRHLPADARIVDPTEVNDPKDILHLMARCQHAVIANSSLSWWGAWLISGPSPFVAAPRPWFADSWRNARDLLPSTWHSIDRTPGRTPLNA